MALVYKFTASSLPRNYETSLISADPLCLDLRPVMAAIISCGFERRIIVIRESRVKREAVENSAMEHHNHHHHHHVHDHHGYSFLSEL